PTTSRSTTSHWRHRDEEVDTMSAPVRVLAVQTLIREATSDATQRDRAITHNLYRSIALVDKAVQRGGRPDIVVLPEFFLQGYASTRTHADALAVGVTLPGRETETLGAVAAEHGCYIAGAAWEVSAEWPNR